MTTKELIEKLQEIDPDGNAEVFIEEGKFEPFTPIEYRMPVLSTSRDGKKKLII